MHPTRLRPRATARRPVLGLLLAALLLAGCRQAPPELPGAASEPAGAVRLLATHLQNNDLVGFARDALPPEEHARLAAAWREDRSRWPVTELPLDEHLAGLLAALAAPDSEITLRRHFDRQFAGQDAALHEAARSLALFGAQYLRVQGDYSPEEREHYTQLVTALGSWAEQAPLGHREHAYAAIDRLAAAARATGLASEEDLRQAGMEETLRRLGPFLGECKGVLASYGLDLDRSLADLRTGLVQQDGDRATVRVHYPLAGAEIDTVVSLARRNGRWYLTDYLEHAASLLATPEDGDGAPADAVPAGAPPPAR
ncbi:hypothetical protein [Pseudoxanthomonas taiwanensis]|uniref:DUF3828 domain-containing protein n=1 Tax=Pseudoxanthomonas taiwanensis TaxID=176598 RepID=A0A921NXL2_9GAMM|nr:hypothetical protein [Pseudoxanthomonas taiwanensis]KAF1688646.1 hypothetical protein CR938_09065 [Pseudoxanthomonas taiwanensis]